MSPLMVLDDQNAYPRPVGPLSAEPVAGPPQGLLVSDGSGLLATFTAGAKTVTVRGQRRTFTERKRPFVDSFTRTVTGGWGQSPGGGTWLNLAGSDALFSVDGSQGVIVNDTANTGRYASVNDGDIADVSASCKVTASKAATGAATSIALTFGYVDSSNHYRARLLINTTSTVQLALEKTAGGTTTTLGAAAAVGSGFTAGQWWRIRVQRTASTVRCRAWLDGTAEPSAWLHSATDTALPTGRIGVRSFASTGSTALPFNTLVDEVAVDSAVWANPPTVTHDTWVRVLNSPFNGTWTTGLANQVRAWSADSTPDVLAYAMMYVTGAPAVTSAALDGKKVFGEAQYGPLKPDGTRSEFSDWNDYIGIPWTYPNGETRGFPHGEITVSGCLDCSGFVRTVYGRHLGIPMVFDQGFDGINLPRRTRDIGPSGPGVLIQDSTGAPPPLAGIRPGDVVLFDADQSEPVEGQIDHNGIYLGQDPSGNHRFISSRKVVSGPTFSDLGGPSTLNGTGTYAKRLRKVRRF
ncbi:C40 family peptidase [Streptomyces alboflavus]|uniref:C40 family peptidase n=1 Tax=Streptomyces alboflavus TaxID=67267 RepID=UPI001F000E6B|nr:NlpC/P60 family protein [Streptomyces alboflavus]